MFLGDCLRELPKIEAKSIDLILTDLPYGITNCKWDIPIPLDALWQEYKRILKCNGAIVLFADEPFTSLLITSNLENFKYKITWDKGTSSNFLNAKIMPLKRTEDICVFGYGRVKYYPIMGRKDRGNTRPQPTSNPNSDNYNQISERNFNPNYDKFASYPTNLIKFPKHAAECNPLNIVHPTQKPVKLFEYLIKTYTQEGDTVLDSCAGSGTTAVACLNTNRKYVCIEKELAYFEIMQQRIKSNKIAPSQTRLLTVSVNPLEMKK